MVGKRRKRCLLAVVAALAVPSVSLAELTTHIDRAGRLVGAGWGDGYHACESSGIRVGADLPPRSYSQRDSGKPPHHRVKAIRRVAATFYDRFDDARGHCAGGPCDDLACDAPGIFIDGSQVIQTPPGEPIPVPTVAPIPLSQTPPVAPSPVAPSPQSLATTAGPAEPASVASQPSSAVVTPDVPAELPVKLPVEMRNSTAASRMRQPIRVPDADHAPSISGTPHGIVPTHPGFRTPSRTERLLQAALGKDFKMPPAPRRTPAESLAGPASDASVINAAEQVGSKSIPDAKIAEVTVPAAITPPVAVPAKTVADSPATPSPLPAIEPRIDLNRDSLTGGRAEKPTRSSTATAQPAGIILHVSPNIQTNPLVLPRATLELAKRPPNPDSQVIRQPR